MFTVGTSFPYIGGLYSLIGSHADSATVILKGREA